MDGMSADDLGEFDTPEAEIDAMLKAGKPVRVTGPSLPGHAVIVSRIASSSVGLVSLGTPGIFGVRITAPLVR